MGGVDFISAYPMSPATGILTFMAKHSKEFNILVEQAEDEIAAINMGLGAWYAGARAMTGTSGGGFDLMCEAVSLAGMIESPMVIYLGQRPGPATGLPTRTEQGDLNLALYSGHGEFPRIILTPGNIKECFYLSQMAFDLADKIPSTCFYSLRPIFS
jgi:2-oxoglutarate ferredoxin oxidoreductase subunit alpha